VLQCALLPPHSPLEKTPHNARVIGVTLVATLVTSFQMAAERGRATQLDIAEYPFLPWRQRGRMRSAELLAVSAHDIGDFQCRPHRRGSGLGFGIDDGQWQQI